MNTAHAPLRPPATVRSSRATARAQRTARQGAAARPITSAPAGDQSARADSDACHAGARENYQHRADGSMRLIASISARPLLLATGGTVLGAATTNEPQRSLARLATRPKTATFPMHRERVCLGLLRSALQRRLRALRWNVASAEAREIPQPASTSRTPRPRQCMGRKPNLSTITTPPGPRVSRPAHVGQVPGADQIRKSQSVDELLRLGARRRAMGRERRRGGTAGVQHDDLPHRRFSRILPTRWRSWPAVGPTANSGRAEKLLGVPSRRVEASTGKSHAGNFPAPVAATSPRAARNPPTNPEERVLIASHVERTKRAPLAEKSGVPLAKITDTHSDRRGGD